MGICNEPDEGPHVTIPSKRDVCADIHVAIEGAAVPNIYGANDLRAFANEDALPNADGPPFGRKEFARRMYSSPGTLNNALGARPVYGICTVNSCFKRSNSRRERINFGSLLFNHSLPFCPCRRLW